MKAITVTLFVTLGLSACLRVERPYVITAEELVAALSKDRRSLRSLRAETRMRIRSPEGEEIGATVRLMGQQSGSLRIDAVSPLDSPLLTFVSHGGTFAVIDARENKHFHGPASPCNLSRLFGLRFAANDFLAIIGGRTPLIPHSEATVEWDSRAAEEILTLRSDQTKQVIRLRGIENQWDLVRSEISELGEPEKLMLRLVPAEFAPKDGLRLPGKLLIEQPFSDGRVLIDFRRMEANLELPQAAFELPVAGGLPSEYVDCRDRATPAT